MNRIRKNYLLALSSIALIVPILIGLSNAQVLPADAASSNTVYLSPTPISVKSGASFTATLRVNPSTPIDGLQTTVSYDSSKLTYVSGAIDSTSFSMALQAINSSTAGKLSLAVGNLTGNVSTDSPVATFTFKAKVGTGSTDLTMTSGTGSADTNATANGAYTNPATAKATVNFAAATVAVCPTGQTGTPPNCVTPAPQVCPTGETGTPPNCVVPPKNCATGQTGTPPNCVTPAPAKCATGTTGTPPNCVKTVGTTPVKGVPITKDPTPVNSTPVSTGNVKSSPAAPTVSLDSVETHYTFAAIQITSSTKTKAHMVLGTTKTKLTSSTTPDDYALVHTLYFSANHLKPGTTYFYAVVAVDAQGNQTQTSTQTFKTKGMYVKIHVTDKNGHPIANSKVTLHSTPTVVTTDKDGYAIFDDIEPGNHKLIYNSGIRTYSEAISVASIILTTAQGETTQAQTATIRYPFNSSDTIIYVLVAIVLVLIAVIIYAFFYVRKTRKPLTAGGNTNGTLPGAPTSDPVVPAAITNTPATPAEGDQVIHNYFNQQPNSTDGQEPWQNPGQK